MVINFSGEYSDNQCFTNFRCHKYQDSLFSWSSGFNDFSGFVNWGFVLLLMGGVRLLLENLLKWVCDFLLSTTYHFESYCYNYTLFCCHTLTLRANWSSFWLACHVFVVTFIDFLSKIRYACILNFMHAGMVYALIQRHGCCCLMVVMLESIIRHSYYSYVRIRRLVSSRFCSYFLHC